MQHSGLTINSSGVVMPPANTTSCLASLKRYASDVQIALIGNGASGTLSIDEVHSVEQAWLAGERSDLCAALIRTDRHLNGLAQQHA